MHEEKSKKEKEKNKYEKGNSLWAGKTLAIITCEDGQFVGIKEDSDGTDTLAIRMPCSLSISFQENMPTSTIDAILTPEPLPYTLLGVGALDGVLIFTRNSVRHVFELPIESEAEICNTFIKFWTL